MSDIISVAHISPAGEVRVSDQAIHTIVNTAIAGVPGAVLLLGDRNALSIESVPGGITVVLRIAVQYGASMSTVSQTVAEQVQSKLEYMLGLQVVTIKVLVQGTRR